MQGGESSLDDFVYHLICPCCTLSQVSSNVKVYFHTIKMYASNAPYCLVLRIHCELEQESRTLELNNVQDGIWHGRGDTICIQSFSNDDSKAYLESSPSFVVSTKSPDLVSMQKPENDVVLSTSLIGQSCH